MNKLIMLIVLVLMVSCTKSNNAVLKPKCEEGDWIETLEVYQIQLDNKLGVRVDAIIESDSIYVYHNGFHHSTFITGGGYCANRRVVSSEFKSGDTIKVELNICDIYKEVVLH